MSDRAFKPPRFQTRRTDCGLWVRYRVYDTERQRFCVGSPLKTKRACDKRADTLNAREIKAKAGLPKTRLEKLRNLNYAGDPAPIRQYKD